MQDTSPLIRLAGFQPSELPSHPALASTDSADTKRPDLVPFVLALLDQTNNYLHPQIFNLRYKSHSHKPSPPSNTDVEILTYSLPASDISQINWSDPATTAGVGRVKPRDIKTEHWCARRSYHSNVSSKVNPATASWEEFVFGLRDNHSKHEQDFTPTLYDARHILDWSEEIQKAGQAWKLGDRSAEAPGQYSYTDITLSIYEMCHEIPFPLQPRCFPVLVATASINPSKFVAVTVPVNLSSFEGAFYSNGRNRTEGTTPMQKKQVVLGAYSAMEKCELYSKHEEGKDTKEEIEWLMTTASDAKGNLPMAVQKSSMPGQVVKDVGYFLKWIHGVDRTTVSGSEKAVQAETATKPANIGSAR